LRGQFRVIARAPSPIEKTVELTDDPTALAMLAQGCAKIGQSDKDRNVLSQLNAEALKLNVES
jgi:hypothetical protein